MADAACPGFRFAGVASGMKGPDELDLGLVAGDADLVAAAVFTQNRFRAAPVELSEARVKSGTCRAIVVNAGNANAFVPSGRQDAESMTHYVARALDCDEKRVLVASTGTVGRPLPIEPIVMATPRLVAALAPDGLDDFVKAIQTTDRIEKRALRLVPFGKKSIGRVLGVAKGSGLLGPDLATTLAFVVTDVVVGKAFLKKALASAVAQTFNRSSVDGEASTNDALFALSSGKLKNKPVDSSSGGADGFVTALTEVLDELARGVVRDARGTTHVVTFEVSGAANEAAALTVARHLARALPVKAALFGADPAWARLLSSMGNCGVELSPTAIDIAVGEIDLVRAGVGLGVEAERRAHDVMRRGEYALRIRVGKGKGQARYVGCDLSVDAVRAAAGSWT